MADQSTSVTGNPTANVAPPPNVPRDEVIFFLFMPMTLVVSIFSICFLNYVIWVGLFLHYPQFVIETVTITNFSLSSYSQITGDWEVDFLVRNPNSKVNLYYNETEFVVLYKSDSVAQTTLPSFVQRTNNETTIRATLTSLMMCVHDRDSINVERSHGAITCSVRMMARVRTSAWWAENWKLVANCSNLQIAVGNGGSGTLVGGSKKCTAFDSI